MLTLIISQFRRRPLPALAVILFAVVISFALGGLQQSNDAERESYETIYETTPVTFAVTDLYGEDSGMIRGWIADTFAGTGASEPYLAEYVTDLKMELTWYPDGEYSGYTLSGITSAATVPLLDSACGAQVTWFDGYDESSIEKDEFICVIPQSLYETLGPDAKELKLEFYIGPVLTNPVTGEVEEKSVYRTFAIAGTYESIKREYSIYCPYIKVRRLLSSDLSGLNIGIYVNSIEGTLKDNYRLEEFKAAAANWFAEPSPTGEKTPWGRWGYEYYLYALDINDTVLQRVTHNYQISMVINRLSFALVFAFSAAAGFFIGFLLIRSRKREIGLMRTLGASNFRIYLGFAAEQLLCVAAGILLGGALMDFNAPGQLAVFALVYCIGLSAALIVFLHRNLISAMKEDE